MVYFCLFGEGEAELQDEEEEEEEEEEEQELALESERGDLLRYLLFSLPLTGGLGGGVGRVHGAVWSSAARPQSCCATLSGSDGTLSVDGFVSDLVLGSSGRGRVTDFAELLTALMAVLTSQVEVCFLHSAAALESWVVTCDSSVVLEISLGLEALLRWVALVSERSTGPQ